MDYKLKYYQELAKKYTNKRQVASEIINLQAIVSLPKGTEHFISDIHGEYEMFVHILKTASGVIKRKIDEEFGDSLDCNERAELASLIYYPKEKLNYLQVDDDMRRTFLYRLIRVCRHVSLKYTRSKVRKQLPKNYAYIMDELLNCDSESTEKERYYKEIIETILELKQGDGFIIDLCQVIQSLAVDHLHIVGDIYDRGPRADIVVEHLQGMRAVDIQWGNHDVLWIGANLGNEGCILSVLCDSFKYGNIEFLEEGYAINLHPLYEFVEKYYPTECPIYKTSYNNSLNARLLRAVMIMRFKVEDEYRTKYPQFGMSDQTVLDKIDFGKATWSGYEMTNTDFPTVDRNNPTELNDDEKYVLNKLKNSFMSSEKLSKHINFLMNKGSLYLKYNGNLLFHGCIPLNKDGTFKEEEFGGQKYSGKKYLDFCDQAIRKAYKTRKDKDTAFIWQLWCGNKSPIFGKDKMTTFERLYVVDKSTHKEHKQHYFELQDNEQLCNNILIEFGLDPDKGRIINGHIPVKHSDGESPIKAGGKMLVIDGGMSKPYQKVTGIAGYTMTYHSYGISIASHAPFFGKDAIVQKDAEVLTEKHVVSRFAERVRVADTDIGAKLLEDIADLKELMEYYNQGKIKQG